SSPVYVLPCVWSQIQANSSMIALRKMIVPTAPHAYQAAPMIEKRIIPPMPTASATPTTHNQNFPPSSSMSAPLSAGASFPSGNGGGIVLNGCTNREAVAPPGEGRSQPEQERGHGGQEAVDEHCRDNAGVVAAEADEGPGEGQLDDAG